MNQQDDSRGGEKLMIQANGIIKDYHLGETIVHALRGIDLEVEKGVFISIMGPSGSGKTTLLNILGAIDKATSGSVKVNGVDLSREKNLAKFRRETVGFIFQQFYLISNLTAKENVTLPLVPIKNKEVDKWAIKLLEKVGLAARVNHKPYQLSGGERQRVTIARALINNPKIILCDEITGMLDSKTGRAIMTLLQTINKDLGTTIILVTHNSEMATMTDKTYYLLDGVLKDQP